MEFLVDVPSEFRNEVIPRGTRGPAVDHYEHPREGYSGDVAIPEASHSTGKRTALPGFTWHAGLGRPSAESPNGPARQIMAVSR